MTTQKLINKTIQKFAKPIIKLAVPLAVIITSCSNKNEEAILRDNLLSEAKIVYRGKLELYGDLNNDEEIAPEEKIMFDKNVIQFIEYKNAQYEAYHNGHNPSRLRASLEWVRDYVPTQGLEARSGGRYDSGLREIFSKIRKID